MTDKKDIKLLTEEEAKRLPIFEVFKTAFPYNNLKSIILMVTIAEDYKNGYY